MGLSIRIREEGRGQPITKKFSSLEQATKFIREYWQGADYVDGVDGFHTDYSTFELIGFNLSDIGEFYVTDDGCREFRFGRTGNGEFSVHESWPIYDNRDGLCGSKSRVVSVHSNYKDAAESVNRNCTEAFESGYGDFLDYHVCDESGRRVYSDPADVKKYVPLTSNEIPF